MEDNELQTIIDNILTVGKNTPINDIYSEKDPVIILDDGDFIAGHKIRDKKWSGSGIIMAYAKWCPHCQNKVKGINEIALTLKESEKAIYVIDAYENPIFHFSNNIEGYPTFFKILDNGTIGKDISTTNGKSSTLSDLKTYI